jgi:hypothetical protein
MAGRFVYRSQLERITTQADARGQAGDGRPAMANPPTLPIIKPSYFVEKSHAVAIMHLLGALH